MSWESNHHSWVVQALKPNLYIEERSLLVVTSFVCQFVTGTLSLSSSNCQTQNFEWNISPPMEENIGNAWIYYIIFFNWSLLSELMLSIFHILFYLIVHGILHSISVTIFLNFIWTNYSYGVAVKRKNLKWVGGGLRGRSDVLQTKVFTNNGSLDLPIIWVCGESLL